jgi:ABC-type nitrate/sulfonate/bicarbonate transport system substrate-binding protein
VSDAQPSIKKRFFDALGGALVKAAVWCLEHPDAVIAAVNKVKK